MINHKTQFRHFPFFYFVMKHVLLICIYDISNKKVYSKMYYQLRGSATTWAAGAPPWTDRRNSSSSTQGHGSKKKSPPVKKISNKSFFLPKVVQMIVFQQASAQQMNVACRSAQVQVRKERSKGRSAEVTTGHVTPLRRTCQQSTTSYRKTGY